MKSHRGLSSAVGAVFLIIVLTTGMTYVATSINTIGDFSEQVIIQDSHRMAKEKEAFEIISIKITSLNKLDGVIQNTGQVPLKITNLWIDVKGINDEVQKIPVDAAIAIGDTINLIDYDIDYTMDPLKGYNMKFVSSRGEVQSYFVNSSDEIKLHTQLNALPETIPVGFDTVILFTVHNNATSNNALLNLTPQITIVPAEAPATSAIVTGSTISDPPSYPSLKPGESTTFKWVFTINGETDDDAIFEVELQNGYPNNEETITVTITEIQFAALAATATSSQSFNPVSSSTGDLVLHQEYVEKIPTGYQLEQKLADGGGINFLLDVIDPKSPEFFTNNGTEVIIDPGIWEVNLVYYSDPFPKILENSMDGGGMIFHFEDSGNGIDGYEDNSFDCNDSTGEGQFADYRGLSVEWNEFGGPNNTGSYTFDGTEDYFRIQIADCNDLSNTDTTIAGWFKAPSGGNDYIYYAGKKDGTSKEHFAVRLDGNGYVVFSYETDDGVKPVCNSDKAETISYRDDQWHHFVGVRESDDDCRLYIDGVQKEYVNVNGGGSFIDMKSPYVYIGARLLDDNHPYPVTDYFAGSLDDIMYWNNYALSAAEVVKLYETSYGEDAHEMTFTFSKTDDLGFNDAPIITDIGYKMNFLDGKRDNKAVKSFKYSSAPELLSTTILDQERIQLVIELDNPEVMKMTLRIDDTSLTERSYMALPSFDPSFHPSTTHDNDVKFSTGITSGGPFGAWITKAGTRIILTDPGTEISYAGIIDFVNTVKLSESKDSVFIQKFDQVDLSFHRITLSPNDCLPNPPGELCSNDIPPPPGEYDGQILIIGYNDQGNENTWKVDLGKIKVTE